MMDVIFIPEFLARFWSKVDVQGIEKCWTYKGALSCGYGVMHVPGYGQRKAIRIAYMLFNEGQLSDDLVIDHRCRNPACVNPYHLEAVTPGENVRRGISPTAFNGRKTHCLRGHPLSGDNLFYTPDGRRQCRSCRNERSRISEKKRRAAGKKRRKV